MRKTVCIFVCGQTNRDDDDEAIEDIDRSVAADNCCRNVKIV